MDTFAKINKAIRTDPANGAWETQGYAPLYTASAGARIVLVGQAPGKKAQESGIPWSDASGTKLRTWLGVSEEQFYDQNLISILPMDFYYPGKGTSGDLPPRKDFAPTWHPRLLALMPNVQLFVLIGRYAHAYYLRENMKKTLTETVHPYEEYLPRYFPLVHPSPLNFRWLSKNPWFEQDVVSILQQQVREVLDPELT